jgi:Transcriptional regulator, AbiEi antitoxin
MGGPDPHKSSAWRIARQQHGLITRAQLLELGYTRHAIRHRVSTGRLHPIHRGVFVVGRPELDMPGRCMAAVLACGPESMVSHQTAAELWGVRPPRGGPVEISVPAALDRAVHGIRLHRRRSLDPSELQRRLGIPITSPIRTLVDLATRLQPRPLEAAVNEADKLDLIDPETLRLGLDGMRWQRGVPALRRVLDRRTFRLTDSELERIFLRLVRAIGLPTPGLAYG